MYILTDLNFNIRPDPIFGLIKQKSHAVHRDHMAASGHHQKSSHYPDVALIVDGENNLPDCCTGYAKSYMTF